MIPSSLTMIPLRLPTYVPNLPQHDPGSLPCFANLPEELKRPIRFTQAKLGFNHGWLVQAEAPPGALFGSFKALLESEDVPAHDVAFYFVHWLTDLAGAEPSSGGPMCGLLYTYP